MELASPESTRDFLFAELAAWEALMAEADRAAADEDVEDDDEDDEDDGEDGDEGEEGADE